MAQIDRAHSPLILPAHAGCNGSFSHSDERVGQFLSLLHGRRLASDKNLLKFSQVNSDHMALPSVDLYSTVWRWLRAFHAVLYWQPLDIAGKYAIELPCNVLTPGPSGIALDAGRPRQRRLCEETLQRNRDTRNLDRIAAWNGRLRYECVWELTPINAYCVFWLDFYGWRRLSAISHSPPQDCVGFYVISRERLPPLVTRGTSIVTLGTGDRFGL